MERRRLLAGVALGAALGAARAQGALPRIGILWLGTRSPGVYEGVARRLRQLGWEEGRNFILVPGFADGRRERVPQLADELVRQKVDLIVAFTDFPITEAKRATRSIPIVGWGIHGALEIGLVTDLARPGGNLTGAESLAIDADAKRVQLLRQLAPAAHRVGVFCNPDDPGTAVHLVALRRAGAALGLAFTPMEARRVEDVAPLLEAAARDLPDALTATSDYVTVTNWKLVAEFAIAHRVPSVCEFSAMARQGALMSYGPTFGELDEIVARQVDRILRGAGKPATMPIERTTRFMLVVNRQTAAALGLALPRDLLVGADEVIG